MYEMRLSCPHKNKKYEQYNLTINDNDVLRFLGFLLKRLNIHHNYECFFEEIM